MLNVQPSNPFAALGESGATFGGGGGFNFGSLSTAPKPVAGGEEGAEGGEEGAAGPEEECQAEFKPLVQLEEVETNTGEEDEDTLIEQ